MNFPKAWTNISVIGASGKMGKGISQILLEAQLLIELETEMDVGTGNFLLHLVDCNELELFHLKNFLKNQIERFCEKNISLLRQYLRDHPDLVTNGEMIHYVTEKALQMTFFSTQVEEAASSLMVFEAIKEEINEKVKVLEKLKSVPHLFTNTSSIPIHILTKRAHLPHNLIGFHFYNPPQIQTLAELVIPKKSDPATKALVEDISKRLKRQTVFSEDIAGFIGNGYLIREIAYACHQVRVLIETRPLKQAIYLVDQMTKHFLIRPMGIFQLADFYWPGHNTKCGPYHDSFSES